MRKKQTVRTHPDLVMKRMADYESKDALDSATENKNDAKMEDDELDKSDEEMTIKKDVEEDEVDAKDVKRGGEIKEESLEKVKHQEEQKQENTSGGSDTDAHEEPENSEKNLEKPVQKRGRGRPRKQETVLKADKQNEEKSEKNDTDGGEHPTQIHEKRKRGRPRKITQEGNKNEEKSMKQELENTKEKITRGSQSPRDRGRSIRVMNRKEPLKVEQEDEEEEEEKAPRKRGRPPKVKGRDENNVAEKRFKFGHAEVKESRNKVPEAQPTQKRGRGRPRKEKSLEPVNQIKGKRGRSLNREGNAVVSDKGNLNHLSKKQKTPQPMPKTGTNPSTRRIVHEKAKLQRKFFREDLDVHEKKYTKRNQSKTHTSHKSTDEDSDESEPVNVEETTTLIEATPEKYAANGDPTSDEEDDDDEENEDEDDSDESESSTEINRIREKIDTDKINKISSENNLTKDDYKQIMKTSEVSQGITASE